MTISQQTANAALQCVRKLANEYRASYATDDNNAVGTSAYIIAKLLEGNALPTDSTPQSLGVLVFGEEFIANKATDNWQHAYIHAIVTQLRAD